MRPLAYTLEARLLLVTIEAALSRSVTSAEVATWMAIDNADAWKLRNGRYRVSASELMQLRVVAADPHSFAKGR